MPTLTSILRFWLLAALSRRSRPPSGLTARLIRSLAGLLVWRCLARSGRLLLRGRAGGPGRSVVLILAIAIYLLLSLLMLGISGLVRILRAAPLGLAFAAWQLLLGLLVLLGRPLRVATRLPLLLLRRARARWLARRAGRR